MLFYGYIKYTELWDYKENVPLSTEKFRSSYYIHNFVDFRHFLFSWYIDYINSGRLRETWAFLFQAKIEFARMREYNRENSIETNPENSGVF